MHEAHLQLDTNSSESVFDVGMNNCHDHDDIKIISKKTRFPFPNIIAIHKLVEVM